MEVVLTKDAKRRIAELPEHLRSRMIRKLVQLGDRAYEGKKLDGEYSGCRVIRMWPYRIIYEIRRRELIILVLRIADRKDAYR